MTTRVRMAAAAAALLLAAAVSVRGGAAAKGRPAPADGITVTGYVTCGGQPLAGVRVSDGVLFAATDSTGCYRLASKKFQGSVFVITPSGYEPVCRKGVLPRFWAPLDSRKPDKCERHDFELVRCDNVRHRMIVSADLHLANRSDDLRQLKRLYVPAVAEAVREAERDTVRVYSVILGDLSSSSHWYSNEFDISDALQSIVAARYPAMLYTVMGEQDYDGATPSTGAVDYNAERMYTYACGPKYYSMNIGRVHYVVLDNTLFRNDPGEGPYPAEIVGKRNFDRFVSSDQLAWLRTDLAAVADTDAPVVVFMHHPAIRSSSKGELAAQFTRREQLDSLAACFEGFTDVHFFTGHNHRRRVSCAKSLPHITEHNVPSAAGNNWSTLYEGGQHLCPDGTDGGFEIVEADSCGLRWEYRSLQHGSRTFRTYDMNCVGEYYRTNDDVRFFVADYPVRIDYGADNFAGYVYINYWGYEPGSKLEVRELPAALPPDSVAVAGASATGGVITGEMPADSAAVAQQAAGRRLKVSAISQEDPLYTVSADVVRAKNSRKKLTNIRKNVCNHLFRVRPSGDSTTLVIRSTDRFGRIFEDTMRRPKPFSADMP